MPGSRQMDGFARVWAIVMLWMVWMLGAHFGAVDGRASAAFGGDGP
jgi:hypothetical protein